MPSSADSHPSARSQDTADLARRIARFVGRTCARSTAPFRVAEVRALGIVQVPRLPLAVRCTIAARCRVTPETRDDPATLALVATLLNTRGPTGAAVRAALLPATADWAQWQFVLSAPIADRTWSALAEDGARMATFCTVACASTDPWAWPVVELLGLAQPHVAPSAWIAAFAHCLATTPDAGDNDRLDPPMEAFDAWCTTHPTHPIPAGVVARLMRSAHAGMRQWVMTTLVSRVG